MELHFYISCRVCRHLLSGSGEAAERLELGGVFILCAVTCCSFRRDCLFSHSAHSALFINTQTQEVLFIRQSDRDQSGVGRTLAQRVDCVRSLRIYGGLCSAKHLAKDNQLFFDFFPP